MRKLLGGVVLAAAACGGGKAAIDAPPGGGDGAVIDGPVGGPDADLSCPTPGVLPAMKLTTVASGLDQPLYATTPPGDPGSLYVVGKKGTIHIVRGGATLPTPFLDITAKVNVPYPQADGGLLSMLFAKDYASSGTFYVYYSAKADGTHPDRVVIQEYHRSAGNPDVADPTPVRDLIDTPHGGYNDLGGQIAWGPDGMMYWSSGDAAQSPSQAADKSVRLGKILRLDAANPGTPPSGNATGGDPYLWDWGLRNVWRMSFDRTTGDLYLADVGDQLREEIDVEPTGGGKVDYGWDVMEGSVCHVAGCTPRGVAPTIDHDHAENQIVIGGYVYRGAALPCLRGRYIYGDFGTGRFWSFVYSGGAATSKMELTDALGGSLPGVDSFGEDANGELYLVTITGTVYRIDPA